MLDNYDERILSELRADSRISWAMLSKRINLSASACQRRAEALVKSGVIENFSINVNDAALGKPVRAFVSVNVDRTRNELAQDFRTAVIEHPNVQRCHMLSGSIDFMLEVVAEDLASFGDFINGELLTMPAVKDASSSIVLDVVKLY